MMQEGNSAVITKAEDKHETCQQYDKVLDQEQLKETNKTIDLTLKTWWRQFWRESHGNEKNWFSAVSCWYRGY